jgi:hypothetical protein
MDMDGARPAGTAAGGPAKPMQAPQPDRRPGDGRFRVALMRPPPGALVDGGVPQGAALPPDWFRADRAPEAAPAPPPHRPGASAVDHVLVGEGPRGPEARLRISAGALAGSEIRLVAVGSTIEVQLLTPSEGSRQTLIVAIEAIRDRLRQRGIALRLCAPVGPSPDAAGARSRRARR